VTRHHQSSAARFRGTAHASQRPVVAYMVDGKQMPNREWRYTGSTPHERVLREDGRLPERRGADEPGGGWLSPAGAWWPCPDWMHLDLAQRLVEELRLPVGEQDPADYLHGTGWLRCWDNGTTWPPDCPMTQTQRDRLWDLARAHEQMREHILVAIRNQ
jgi:hypothetical protein